MVARETGHGHGEICHTYALFRDCGMAVMLQKFPIYAEVFDGVATLLQPEVEHSPRFA